MVGINKCIRKVEVLFKIFNFKTFMFFVILGISIFSYKYLVSSKPQAKPSKVEEKTFYVNVIKTKRNDYTPISDAYGKIVSSRIGDLRFGVSGRIDFISNSFLNGAFVKNGQILAKLDQKRFLLEIKKLKFESQELATQLDIRKRQVKRYKSMLLKKVISQNKYDNELILLSKNKSDFNRSSIILEKAKEDLSDTILKAKFNGRLYNVKINKGQFITTNEKLANIFSLEDLEVEFVIPSKIYSNSINLIGKSINVIWEGGTTPLKKIKAKIERADGKTNEEEGGGKLFAKIINAENKSNYIPLGTFVRVNYPEGNFKNIFKLPETSLYGENIYFVEDGIAKKKKVNLLYKGSGFILVDGNISEKDLIITTRMPDNLNNQKVTILN
jgi:RND family efflux transporter MFP subunit